MKVRDRQVPLTRKMKGVRDKDTIMLPYGDLMGDDAALDRFRKTRKQFFKLGVAKRTIAKPRMMGKAAFAAWRASLDRPLDPDRPLSEII